jgi:hypothetical protein
MAVQTRSPLTAAVSRILSLAAVATLAGAPAVAQTLISVAPFNSVELRGGGHVVIRHGDVQSVTLLKGSTEFTSTRIRDGKQLVIDACNSECPTHYDLEIEIVTPDIGAVAVEGGGAIESAGAFPNQRDITAAVRGGGSVDVRSIDAASATTAVDGGGKIRVKSENALTAAVNGGGRIVYWGDPNVTSAVNGGGSISKGS